MSSEDYKNRLYAKLEYIDYNIKLKTTSLEYKEYLLLEKEKTENQLKFLGEPQHETSNNFKARNGRY